MIRKTMMTALILAAPVAALTDPATRDHATRFTVRIENVSTPTTLRSSRGETAPAPNSPGLWVVHRKPAPLFRSGKPEAGSGLEAQAEDGNPSMLAERAAKRPGVSASGVFNVPAGDQEPGPALPGKRYEFTFTATPGERLSLATMFGQSNDLFYAPAESGIALFDGKGRPISGDVTSKLLLWDAGTEVNQEPGFGPDQAPRQAGPNTGAAEMKSVAKVKDAYSYPPVGSVLKVTVTPSSATAQR